MEIELKYNEERNLEKRKMNLLIQHIHFIEISRINVYKYFCF